MKDVNPIVATCTRNGVPSVITEKEMTKLYKEYQKDKKELEDMEFTCSLCDKKIKNKDGHYVKYKNDTSRKICKTHIKTSEGYDKDIKSHTFTCSFCEKRGVKDKDGYFMFFDKPRNVLVCKTHIPDKKANIQEVATYAQNKNRGTKK